MIVIEVAVSRGTQPGTYDVEVVQSTAGEASATVAIDAEGLLAHRDSWQSSLLASAARTRRLVPEVVERPLREVGEELFKALFSSPALAGRYRACLAIAQDRDEPLRVVLRLNAPELAPLPWEAMYDSETGSFLSRREALLRHVPVARGPAPLAVTRPLRILAIASAPRGLAPLDADREAEYLAQALADPIKRGTLEVTWAPSATWEAIQTLLLSDQWHIIHFVGHGDFDLDSGEGVLAFVGPDGRSDLVEASRFVDLLGEAEPTPRLVVLNSCASGESDAQDLFSGTAAALVRSGINAVAAMQFEVTDAAAIAFARGFYTAIAQGRAVDDAMRSGRVAILGTNRTTFEWVTPVLYLRGDPHLFTIESGPATTVAVGPVATDAPGSTAEARTTSDAETQAASDAETQTASDAETQTASDAETQTASDAETRAGTEPVSPSQPQEAYRGERAPAKEDTGPVGPVGPPVAPEPEPGPDPKRRRRLVAAAVGLALVATGAGAWLWPRNTPPGDGSQQSPSVSSSASNSATTTTGTTTGPTIGPSAPLLTWQPVPGVPAIGGAGVAVHQGELWVVGGASGTSAAQATVRVYNPTTRMWRAGPALPQPRGYASLVSNGEALFLIGGLSGEIRGLRTVYRLDSGAAAWFEDRPLPEGRFSGAAAWDGSRIVFGGGVELRTPRAAASDIWALRNGSWSRIGRLTTPREHLAAATDGAGTVWFLGGADVNGGRGSLSATVETIKGSTVAKVASLPTALSGLSAVWTPEFGVCAFGGSTTQPNARTAAVATTTCLGAGSGAARWPDLPQARNVSSAAVVGDTVYVVGGNSAAEAVLSIRYR